MTYSIHFWEYPIPCREELTGKIFSDLQAYEAPQNPRFLKLAKALTQRYPSIEKLDEPEDGVWTDGPLDGKTDSQVYGIGILSQHLDEVFPFVLETAGKQRLCVYDTQSGIAYAPDGQQVNTNFVEPGTPRLEAYAKLDIALAEHIIRECIGPILEKAGFRHIGYQYVRPVEDGWQAVRYGLGKLSNGEEYLRVLFGVNFRPVVDAMDAIGKSSSINEVVTQWGAVLQEFSSNKNSILPVRSMVELVDTLKWVPDLLKQKVVPFLNRCTTLKDFDRFFAEETDKNNRLVAEVESYYRVLLHLLAHPEKVKDFDAAYPTMIDQWTPEDAASIGKVIKYLKTQQSLALNDLQWGQSSGSR